MLAGSIDADAADKAAHFITVADAFHLPLVFLADNPGVLPGTRSERAGRAAQRRPDVRGPDRWRRRRSCTSRLRKAYGFGSMVMALRRLRPPDRPRSPIPAPPSAPWARARRAGPCGPTRTRAAELRQAELQASYRSASGLGFDELIDPRETRDALLGALLRSLSARQAPAGPVSRTAITP